MDYKTEIEIESKVEICFKAITQEIDKWWGKVDNPISAEGDEFSVFFEETEWRFEIDTFEPLKKVEWRCIYANYIHEGFNDMKEEWLNTVVYWNIEETIKGTKISMKHKGLKESLVCYDVCIKGWDYFVNSSLKKYLTT